MQRVPQPNSLSLELLVTGLVVIVVTSITRRKSERNMSYGDLLVSGGIILVALIAMVLRNTYAKDEVEEERATLF